jgi:hypothetical protein
MAHRANRFDPDGVVEHRRVAHAAEYSIELPLYMRTIGNGSVKCVLLKSPTPAKRIVQLIAEYKEAGVYVHQVVQCISETEELAQLQRLERVILEASRRPST